MAAQMGVQELVDKIRGSMVKLDGDPRMPESLRKSTFQENASATSGLTFYDLELGAKFLYPVPTPLRNITPRVSGKGGVQASWRAVTAINTGNIRGGIPAGARGGILAVATQDYVANYKGIGIDDSVDFEAYYAGQGFDDVRAIAAKVGLEGTMLLEEKMILGGNTGVTLGTTPTPTIAGSTTGGTLATMTLSVICMALAYDGFTYGSVAGGIQPTVTNTPYYGSAYTINGGVAQKSAAGTASLTGPTASATASVVPVNGAVGYAWFWGVAGSEVLGAITSINSVSITANAAGAQTAASIAASDKSKTAESFDGFLSIALTPGSGATVIVQASGTAGIGTPLTSDGAAGIVEIDTALAAMYDNYRLGPDTMWVSSQEAQNISKKILSGSTTAAQRLVFSTAQDAVTGGIIVTKYLNKFTNSVIDIMIHPFMPKGTVLMTSQTIPYPLSGVGNVWQIRTRQDYYQIDWPILERRWTYGVYADEVLQHYAPFSMAVITNVGNG